MYIRIQVERAIPAIEKLLEKINEDLHPKEEKGRAEIVKEVHDINEKTKKHILYRIGLLKYKPIILTDERLEVRLERRIDMTETHWLVGHKTFKQIAALRKRIRIITEKLETFKTYQDKGIKSVFMTDNEFSFKDYYD